VIPPLAVAAVCGAAAAVWGGVVWRVLAVGGLVASLFMAYFHRDPERHPPPDPDVLVAGADGRVRRVEVVPDARFPGGKALCISIFLSPLDVHVNRAPVAGRVSACRYVPGRHFFTVQEKSSEYNEHTEVSLAADAFRCFVHQIAGPFVRRVVCWLREGEPVARGGRLGMMRFGSRLDMYFPAERVEPRVEVGQRVRAGETVVARIRR